MSAHKTVAAAGHTSPAGLHLRGVGPHCGKIGRGNYCWQAALCLTIARCKNAANRTAGACCKRPTTWPQPPTC